MTTSTSEIAAYLNENPSAMLSQVAMKFNVPEGTLPTLLPEAQAICAAPDAFEEIWNTACGWEKVTFIAVTPGMVVEVPTKLPRGSHGHGMFNPHEAGIALGGHIMLQKLGAIWFLSRPHFGKESHSIHFYTNDGLPMFALYVGRGEDRELLPAVCAGYMLLRDRFAGVTS